MLRHTQEAKLNVDEVKFRDWLVAGHPKFSTHFARTNSPDPRVSAGRDEHGRDTVLFHLANATGDTVEVMQDAWRISSDPERIARRNRNTGGLPRPDEPRSLPVDFTAFRSLLNLRNDDDWNRCLCWLLAALRPEGPYPILALTGPKWSGKTTVALLLRSLIDPAQHPLGGHPHWVIALDDVNTFPAALMHENHPIILVLQESADSTLTPELAARTLVVQMSAIPEIKRRSIADLWQALKNIRPRVMSSLLLTSVSIALDNRKQPGFADLKDWLLAAEPAIRLSDPETEAILKPTPMPQDLVASAISGLMTDVESWSGTATRLLKVLQDIDATGTGWPQTARTISKSLNLAGILLRRRGIAMIFGPNAEITVTRRAGC
jgi:hypothetical protein